jgi:hypothetical protein
LPCRGDCRTAARATNAARLRLVRGDVDAADALCQSVPPQDRGRRRTRAGETFKHLGVSRARGDYDSAERHRAEAYDNAMRREDLLGGSVSRQAEPFEPMNKNRETLQALTQSHCLFIGPVAAHLPAAGTRRLESATSSSRVGGLDRIEGLVSARTL